MCCPGKLPPINNIPTVYFILSLYSYPDRVSSPGTCVATKSRKSHQRSRSLISVAITRVFSKGSEVAYEEFRCTLYRRLVIKADAPTLLPSTAGSIVEASVVILETTEETGQVGGIFFKKIKSLIMSHQPARGNVFPYPPSLFLKKKLFFRLTAPHASDTCAGMRDQPAKQSSTREQSNEGKRHKSGLPLLQLLQKTRAGAPGARYLGMSTK
ncbi:hypothetical protein KQX54_021709 [Cotesia glomerata]|uniref:Uncharacterized protein n=1 Tax=Cotesia glomerata TaxID=32391 RepID=A0AAV7J9Z9_COTGL|nr:hypothetical protein KQX54_021709 [Cotesia glomerata]